MRYLASWAAIVALHRAASASEPRQAPWRRGLWSQPQRQSARVAGTVRESDQWSHRTCHSHTNVLPSLGGAFGTRHL